jgi:phasin family protein
MYANAPEKLISANKANVETLMFVANTAFASAERLAALNLNTARGLMEDTVANTKAVMSIKNPQELLAMQKSLAQPALDKAIAYSRAIYEIATQTQEVMGKLVEGQVAELNSNVNTALDTAAKNAPAGADMAIAAVKSAIASANSTMDTVKKSAKQAVEMAEANVAAATSATIKTMKAAA